MRIGMVSAEFPPDVGGVGDHTFHLARHLAAGGHAVQVITSARPGSDSASINSEPVPFREPGVVRGVARWDWRIFRILPALARRGGWDILHIQYQPGAYGLHPAINLLPTWMRRLGHAPAVVTTFHDLRVPYLFPKAGPLRRLTVRQLARASHGAIAAAGDDYRQLLAWTAGQGRPAGQIGHIPLANQLDREPPADFDRRAWRAGLGLPETRELVGHFGFVNRSKGVDALVQAVARLLMEGRDLSLLMVGDPLGSSDATNRAYLQTIQELMRSLGLTPRVRWTGLVTPEVLAGWLRCLDLAVLPFRDGASLRRTSLIAAWAHGVPVLTTAPAPATPEELAHARPVAAFVPGADADHLAPAMAALLDDPKRRAALGAAGRAYAARFSWPAVVERTLAIYHAALARSAA